MQVQLVSTLKNKEQLIRFRLHGKSASSAQTDRDRKGRADHYTLVVTEPQYFILELVIQCPRHRLKTNSFFGWLGGLLVRFWSFLSKKKPIW